MEANTAKHLLLSPHGLEDLILHSIRWRNAAVYAPLVLGYTDCCSNIGFMRWSQEANFYTLPPTPHTCHNYSVHLPFLICWEGMGMAAEVVMGRVCIGMQDRLGYVQFARQQHLCLFGLWLLLNALIGQQISVLGVQGDLFLDKVFFFSSSF